MNKTPNSLALTMKDAAKLVGGDYRTIKLGIESGTIPTILLGRRRIRRSVASQPRGSTAFEHVAAPAF